MRGDRIPMRDAINPMISAIAQMLGAQVSMARMQRRHVTAIKVLLSNPTVELKAQTLEMLEDDADLSNGIVKRLETEMEVWKRQME